VCEEELSGMYGEHRRPEGAVHAGRPGVQLTGRVRLRQVTLLTEETPDSDPHDAPRLARSGGCLPHVRALATRKFLKYLREEFALDALLEYAVEKDNPARQVPNPEWRVATAKLRELRASVAELRAEYGRAAVEDHRQSLRGFKIVHAELGRKLREALQRCAYVKKNERKLPLRVPSPSRNGAVVRLAAERQHLSNLLKMVGLSGECDLVQLVQPYYRRAEDEGRTLIQSALASPPTLRSLKMNYRCG